MDRGAWRATVHRVTKSWMRLSDFHFFFFLPAAASASALFPSMGYKHTRSQGPLHPYFSRS